MKHEEPEDTHKGKSWQMRRKYLALNANEIKFALIVHLWLRGRKMP